MRPKTILAVVVLTIAVCAHAVGQNSSAPIDRPQLCVSAFLGVNSINTQPWPALGALGTTLPDCVTTWDALTWPTWEFNLITVAGTPGTVDVTSGSKTVICHGGTTCPDFTAIKTADLTGIQATGAYLAVWNTAASQQPQAYYLPIDGTTGLMAGQFSLLNNAPVSISNAQYHIYYFGRVTTFFDTAAKDNAKVILIWEPTPNQYTGNNSDTNCHNHLMNGSGSCFPPSDLSTGGSCATFFNGGGGTLVGTNDCQTKLAVADLMNFLKQTGRIGTLLGISTGNESNHVPSDVQGQGPKTTGGYSEVGTTVTVTFSATCQFATGQSVTISGAPAGYNSPPGAPWSVLAGCSGGSSFTYTNTTSGLSTGGGGTVSAGDSNATVTSDGEWADTVARHAARAIDICAQAKAVYAAIWCGEPGIDKMVQSNAYGGSAGCSQTPANAGADWADSWWATPGIVSKMDFFGYHGYFGYIPQAQDFAIDLVAGNCPNIRAAVQTLPMWNTEHMSAYASLSSDSMVQVANFFGGSPTCTATLNQRVQFSATPPYSPFQNPTWNNTNDYMVLVGTNNSQDTLMTGVPITNTCHATGGCNGANDSVSWGCSALPTRATGAYAYIYDLTLTYGFAAESFLLQYFRNVAHRPGAIDVMNWEEWINDSNGAQGFPLCFGFNNVGYTTSSCTNLTLNGQALGEALKWMRLGGGVKPTSAFQCATVTLNTNPPACPFQGTMIATGVEANGIQVEVVFYSDLSNSPRTTTTFPAPPWAQHYLSVDGTCMSVTGGTTPTQVTLTHAKPIMFTSN